MGVTIQRVSQSIRYTLRADMKAACLGLLMLLWAVPSSAEPEASAPLAEAIFAGGCFWCMEPPYDALPGVKQTISGYIGGHVKDPTYKQVTSGKTGHYEALKVVYDPSKVSYERLTEVFWRNVDPFDARGQFCDKGPQYLSAIFYLDPDQKAIAERSKRSIQKTLGTDDVVTEILEASVFYSAETYHQDYYQKNPARYKYYRYRCGRDARLKAVWGEAD